MSEGLPCSRDPNCADGHEGMVFQNGHWRDPVKRRATQRPADLRYRHSPKGYLRDIRYKLSRFEQTTGVKP